MEIPEIVERRKWQEEEVCAIGSTMFWRNALDWPQVRNEELRNLIPLFWNQGCGKDSHRLVKSTLVSVMRPASFVVDSKTNIFLCRIVLSFERLLYNLSSMRSLHPTEVFITHLSLTY